ncbi:MAG: D-aminoacyl-tRNA deacylase [Clostridia bacterium]
MKAVVQRVAAASVAVEDEVIGSIGQGLAILLGVVEGDTEREADFLANKITQLRIFTDSQDKMNLSVEDMGGEMLVVSQFTLAADCSHGRRPSFTRAAKPQEANGLYEYFYCKDRRVTGKEAQTGQFGADMKVTLVNDGPVTILMWIQMK